MSGEEAESLFSRLDEQARKSGYNLNPDRDFTMELMDGLLTNLRRYGYMACPCRLADGERELDLDIICPCDYRDADINEYGACYCGLYVSDEVREGGRELTAVPERRPPDPGDRHGVDRRKNGPITGKLELPVYRCRVCGYLCAREEPPGKCPICGVSAGRFQRFM